MNVPNAYQEGPNEGLQQIATLAINDQQTAIESVAKVLSTEARAAVAGQEGALTQVVAPIVRAATSAVERQHEMLSEVVNALAMHAGTLLSRQGAMLGSVKCRFPDDPDCPESAVDSGVNGGDGRTQSEQGREGTQQDRQVFLDEFDPPGGGGGGGEVCTHNPFIAPEFEPSACLVAEWDAGLREWVIRPMVTTSCTPSQVYPGAQVIWYLHEDGSEQRFTVPPDVWPPGIVQITQPLLRSHTPGYENCRWNLRLQYGNPPPSRFQRDPLGQGSETRPPIDPPTEPPPGGRQQPPGEETRPPIFLPPDTSCEKPICGAIEHGVVEQKTYRVPPLLSPYWIRVRCFDRCNAEYQVVHMWCPPREQRPWCVVGPYLQRPGMQEIDNAVRACCAGDGHDPESGIIDPERIPPYVEPPPNDPPPEWSDPPPREECEKPKAIRPVLYHDGYVPVCKTLEQWREPLISEIESYGDVEELSNGVMKELDAEFEFPAYLEKNVTLED